MAGGFEIIQKGDESFRFRLTSGDGTVVAVSPTFTTIKEVVAGIEEVRENAAAGIVVVDRSSCTPLIPARPAPPERATGTKKTGWRAARRTHRPNI